MSKDGAVRTLADGGGAGFADGQGAAARFNYPGGLAVDVDESILVTDFVNNAVAPVAGNGHQEYADGEGAAARFNGPCAVVVDKEGTVVVAGRENHRLRRLTGRHVTTLAGGSEAGTVDGARASLGLHGWPWTSAGAVSPQNSTRWTRCGWWRRCLRLRRGWGP